MKGSRWARFHIKWVGSTKIMGLGFWEKNDLKGVFFKGAQEDQEWNAREHNGSEETLYFKLALPSNTLIAFEIQ